MAYIFDQGINPTKILHYRNRNCGGKFDGTCYITTAFSSAQIATTADANGWNKIRFKPTDLGSKDQCLFGQYDGSNYWALYLNTSDKIEIKYSTDTFEVDYALTNNEYYQVWFEIDTKDIRCSIMDKYSNVLHYEEYVSTTSTLPAGIDDTYIGALNDDETVSDQFQGYIYDVAFTVLRVSSTNNYTVDSIYRLVFKKYYGGVSASIVYAFYHSGFDGTIVDAPSDFWGSETEIDDYIVGFDKMQFTTDAYLTRTAQSFNVDIIDGDISGFVPEVDDTIAVQHYDYNNSSYFIVGLFRIVKIFDANGGVQRLDLEDVFLELKNMYVDKFFQIAPVQVSPTGNQYNFNAFVWWSNEIPLVDGAGDYETTLYDIEAYSDHVGSYADGWFSVRHILNRHAFALQLDYILDLDYNGALHGTTVNNNRMDIDVKQLLMLLPDLVNIGNPDLDIDVNPSNSIQVTKDYKIYDVFEFYQNLYTVLGYTMAYTQYVSYNLLTYFETNEKIIQKSELITDDDFELLPIPDPDTKINGKQYKVTYNISGTDYTGFDDSINENSDGLNSFSLPNQMYLKKRTSSGTSTSSAITSDAFGERLAKQLDTLLARNISTQKVKTLFFVMTGSENMLPLFMEYNIEPPTITVKVEV